MVSIIITTYKEKDTLANAINCVLNQKPTFDYEILIVGPDAESEQVAKNFIDRYQQIRYIKDEHRGKPAALNLAVQAARGDILVLTDGDVWIGENTLNFLVSCFDNASVGAATGHPLPINSRNNIFGYWAHFLT
ncbi:MAG: glycosyltransferase family 2 protein [Patescibacteria group bacterium]|nr:glycosyltransferase family 2 protein [Patescibacteria group bacterium]